MAERGDSEMHEAAASNAEAHQASDAPPNLAEQQAAAMPPSGNGQPSGGGGQADADDDMEDDEVSLKPSTYLYLAHAEALKSAMYAESLMKCRCLHVHLMQ